jgi:hypothetical protein
LGGFAMREPSGGSGALKADKQLPLLKDAFAKHKAKAVPSTGILLTLQTQHRFHAGFAHFNNNWDIPADVSGPD